MKEAMRQRLQTLARALTKSNKTKVQPGEGCTDLTTIYMKDYTEAMEIKPGIKCSRAEAWIATKSLCAHEAGHILFTSKAVWDEYARWCRKEHSLPGAAIMVLNIIEDARTERATALRYPETEKLFRFRNNYEYTHADNLGEGLRAFLNGLFCLAKVGDVPEALNDEEILDLLAECHVHVERGRLAGNTKVAADAAKEVLKIAQPLFNKALEDLPEPNQPPAGRSPQEAPSGDTSGRKQAKNLKKRQKEKKKPEASPEPDDKAKAASGSDEKPEEGTGKESGADAENSEEKDSEESGTAGAEAPLDDLPEEAGEQEVSPDESGGDPEPSETGDQETGDAAPEGSPEDTEEDDMDANDASEDLDDEPADGDEEEPESEDEDSDYPEHEGEGSSDDDFLAADDEEDADDDEDDPDSPGSSEGDSSDDADFDPHEADGSEDGKEDADAGPKTGSPGADDQDADISEDSPDMSSDSSDPDDADQKGCSESDDSKELLRDAEEEIAAIDRRERDLADKAEEVTAEDLSREIKWDVCHHGIAFKSIRASFHGSTNGLKSRLVPLAKKLSGEIQPLLLPKNNAPHRGQSKGRVDARALHKHPSGDKNLFYKKAEPSVVKDVAAYLLIDGSGSMGRDGKYRKAREAAMLCHLALRNLRVVHAATLFTAAYCEDSVTHEEIVRFSESLAADNCDKFMAVREIEDNRDGYSIRIAAKELLARPEKKKLLFVLSDGIPLHDTSRLEEPRTVVRVKPYILEPAILDTRRAVLEATRSGVLVIGVHFGDAPSEAHRLMYNNLVFSQTENLPAALGAAVRKALK